jgi:hypothetical protein
MAEKQLAKGGLKQELFGSNYGRKSAIRCWGLEWAEGYTLVACLRMVARKDRTITMNGVKEAGFVRDLCAERRVENERTGEEEGARPDVDVEREEVGEKC